MLALSLQLVLTSTATILLSLSLLPFVRKGPNHAVHQRDVHRVKLCHFKWLCRVVFEIK